MSRQEGQFSAAAEKALVAADFWEQLQKKYRIVIEDNKAIAFDVYAEQTFTESNLASELRKMCLFLLADWELAQKVLNAD